MRVRFLDFLAAVRASYWFIPTLMMLGAFGLSLVTIDLDERIAFAELELPLIYGAQPDGAKRLLGTVAGSMLTVASLTFSIVMVVLTMASSQFGPRLVGNFMRDRGNQFVLGTFTATFLYCLLILRVVRDGGGEVVFVPQLSVTVALALAVFNLGAFIYFIHHTAEGIQVATIIARVSDGLRRKLLETFPEKRPLPGGEAARAAGVADQLAAFGDDHATLPAPKGGYLRAVDEAGLLQLAEELDLVLRLPHAPGAFIPHDAPLVEVYPGTQLEASRERLAGKFAVGDHRTPEQDLEFLFEQLLEVALRALSPGINDPITAVMCIDRIADNLQLLSDRAAPSPFRCDEAGTVRIIVPVIETEELLVRLFGPIRSYARADHMVLHHLLQALARMAKVSDDPVFRRPLSDEAARILEEAERGLSPSDCQRLRAYRQSLELGA